MAYLFVHFIGDEENGEQIYFSVSRDGLHWTDLGDGPALVSKIGECGVRDPFLVRSRIDGKFYILATDLRIANGKGWEAAQYEGNLSCILWESEDLIHWGQARMVEFTEMEKLGAGCVWAPEAMYDERKDAYLVYWASMTDRKQKMYAAWTRDFRTFSDFHLWIEKREHIIDTTMAEENGIYYRFSACGEQENISLERGSAPDSGDFEKHVEGGIPGTAKTEGPIIVWLKECEKWCLYVDDIGHGAGYVPFLSDSLLHADFRRLPGTEYDFGTRKKRHGSILGIHEDEYERMVSCYGVVGNSFIDVS